MRNDCEPSTLSAARDTRRFPLHLHYCGRQPVNVRGVTTGNLYYFTELQPVQPVDPRDAVFLLASRLFRLVR